MSIFISIAAYEDDLLIKTIKDALEKAENPDQIVFGLGLQYKSIPDLSFLPDSQKRIISWDPDVRPGVIRIRKMIRDLCKEDYFLQIDSHTTFANKWDTGLISDLLSIQKIENNKKILLSKHPTEHREEMVRAIGTPSVFIDMDHKNENFIHTFLFVPAHDPDGSNEVFKKTLGISAGYIFADKDWVENVPYDRFSHSIAEERYLSWVTYMCGWDVYGNFENDFVFHNQSQADNLFKGKDVKRFDNSGNKMFSSDKYMDLQSTSYELSLALIYNDYSKYAIKNAVRETKDFFIEIGLYDLYNKQKEKYDKILYNEVSQSELPKY
jgi:hypothetical protein